MFPDVHVVREQQEWLFGGFGIETERISKDAFKFAWSDSMGRVTTI